MQNRMCFQKNRLNKPVRSSHSRILDGSEKEKFSMVFFSDCKLPQGFRNGALPNSAFSSSSHDDGEEAFHARIGNASKWCPHKAGK